VSAWEKYISDEDEPGTDHQQNIAPTEYLTDRFYEICDMGIEGIPQLKAFHYALVPYKHCPEIDPSKWFSSILAIVHRSV